MARKMADCRDAPSVSGCTLTIAGEEDEVVRAVAIHAKDVHGHEDTPEFRKMIRETLKDEGAGASMPRSQPSDQRPAAH